ncbi:hypothetical protein IWX50DRAFT_233428 [Phyllosticta citricarpa]|uniref:Uncharacterized protein n=1 Tax=Phyllosticta citricarpa TaxID=55181 RepID=A0ABR1L7B6_9PEZI
MTGQDRTGQDRTGQGQQRHREGIESFDCILFHTYEGILFERGSQAKKITDRRGGGGKEERRTCGQSCQILVVGRFVFSCHVYTLMSLRLLRDASFFASATMIKLPTICMQAGVCVCVCVFGYMRCFRSTNNDAPYVRRCSMA